MVLSKYSNTALSRGLFGIKGEDGSGGSVGISLLTVCGGSSGSGRRGGLPILSEEEVIREVDHRGDPSSLQKEQVSLL